MTRRAFAAAAAAAALAGCRSKPNEGPGESPGPSPSPLPADPIARGARWLASKQGADGSWISDVYGAFKDGWTLTPFAALALLEAGHERAAATRGLDWLAARVVDGEVAPGKGGPAYPAYTAALAASAFSKAGREPGVRDAFLNYLRDRQLDESLGWPKSDPHYGGWGYATGIPRKPKPGTDVPDAFLESNLSATAFALDALSTVVNTRTEPAFATARVFVERQQNDDGGFFFIPDDEVRNKAGRDGTKKTFHSYGSMTADGMRALIRCGADASRIARALEWQKSRFDAANHPGTYRPEREETRNSAWFYWAASFARTMRLHGGGDDWWAPALRAELLRRQRADGSWVSELIAVREDDPVVATGFALMALGEIEA